MPIFVNCVCGKRLQGRDTDAGRQTRCPYCGKIITLPQSSDPEAEVPGRAEPVPSAPAPSGPSSREYSCRVCRGSFSPSEVYSEAGAYICKRCFDRQDEDEDAEEPRERWGHINIPGKKRSVRRRYDEDEDEDEIIRPSRSRRGGNVHNYLTEAILVTLFCCLPFGIVAIVKASKVNTCLARGDYHGAIAASDSAKVWCGLSLGLGLAFGVIWVLAVAATGIR